MCIEHIINLVWHRVEEASEDQSHGWCEEEEENPIHDARGPQMRPISGADCLAI
jgi:hypothetical protein